MAQDLRNMLIAACAAVALRVAVILLYSPVLEPDSGSYLQLAHLIAAGHLTGYIATRTPGYPLLLLAVGYSPTATWCLQALLGVITTLLLYRLVRRLGGSPSAALVAALLYSTSLEVLNIERQVMTEAVVAFLITLTASIAVEIVDRRDDLRLPIVLGFVLASVCLVRPDEVAVTVYLVVALLAVRHSATRQNATPPPHRSSIGRAAVAMFLPCAIALIGWASINKAETGVFSVSTVLGYNMIDHVAPHVRVEKGPDHGITAAYVTWRRRVEAQTGQWANVSWAAQQDMEKAGNVDGAHLGSRLLRIGVDVIEDHPLAYLGSSIKRWPLFWVPPNLPPKLSRSPTALIKAVWFIQRPLQAAIAAIFLALCLVEGVQQVRRTRSLLSAPSAILAGTAIVGTIPAVFLSYGTPQRYGYPFFPLVLAVSFASAQVLASWRAIFGWNPARKVPVTPS